LYRITEALLEMHYYRAIVEYFTAMLGGTFLRILKPSPRNESWVGFDQGFVYSEMSSRDLFQELRATIPRATISDGQTDNNFFYLGFFLQFKIVDKVLRKRKHCPTHYYTPFYRAQSDLTPHPATNISQHETLLRLRAIKNAYVAYACPMLFDDEDIRKSAALKTLRIKSLIDAPTGWAQGSPHFICFQTPDDPNPMWKSEESEGQSDSFEDWASGHLNYSPRPLHANQIFNLLHQTHDLFPRFRLYFEREDQRFLKALPDSLRILKFGKLQGLPTSRRKFNFSD
jgi:hypothetical protein